MTDALSHYLPYFAIRAGHLQRSVCGVPIDRRQHSVSPSCPACARWLVQEAKDFAATSVEPDPDDPLYRPVKGQWFSE